LDISGTTILAGGTVSLDAGRSSDQNGIEAFSIDFGDGARRTGPEKSWEHVYESPGVFTVVLKVQDGSGAWSEPVEANITVTLPPKPPPPERQGTSFPLSTPILATLALGIVVAAVAAIAVRRRRRSG
jgi:hypothetical protein